MNIVSNEEMYVENDEQFFVTTFVLLSKDVAKKYTEEVISMPAEEFFKSMKDCSVLMIIENANEHISCRDLMNFEFTTQQLKDFLSYAEANGIFNDECRGINLENMLSDIENPKFCELLSLYGFLHGSGAWEENAKLLYDKGIPLGELISCREDVYEYLYDKLNGKCCDNPSGLVFEIKEAVRMGKYTNGCMPQDIEQLLFECDVLVWYVESMKKILYLFPKTHLIERLKREICKFIK